MKTIKNHATAALILFFPTHLAHALTPDDYQCTIESIHNEKEDSHPENPHLHRGFIVDRRSGVMTGTVRNSYITAPQIIDTGSSENSYKVVTTLRQGEGLGPGSNIHALIINEHEKSNKKSFVYLDNSDVYFGHCIHPQE